MFFVPFCETHSGRWIEACFNGGGGGGGGKTHEHVQHLYKRTLRANPTPVYSKIKVFEQFKMFPRLAFSLLFLSALALGDEDDAPPTTTTTTTTEEPLVVMSCYARTSFQNLIIYLCETKGLQRRRRRCRLPQGLPRHQRHRTSGRGRL